MIRFRLISIQDSIAFKERKSMTGDHLLVIDQGTTSTGAVVYDARVCAVGQSQAEFPLNFPQYGLGRA